MRDEAQNVPSKSEQICRQRRSLQPGVGIDQLHGGLALELPMKDNPSDTDFLDSQRQISEPVMKMAKKQSKWKDDGKFYLSSAISSFTLRRGYLRIDYRPAGFGPGQISITRETDDPSSYCEEISAEQFRDLRSKVLKAMQDMLQSKAANELPEIPLSNENEDDEYEDDDFDDDEEAEDEEDYEEEDEEEEE